MIYLTFTTPEAADAAEAQISLNKGLPTTLSNGKQGTDRWAIKEKAIGLDLWFF